MFVDIHTHILAGIDDGARTDSESLKMLRLAVINGTDHIVVTPHFIHDELNNNSAVISTYYKNIKKLAENHNIPINIYSGCEAFVDPKLPELFSSKVVSTINGSSYFLVELPMMSIPNYTNDVLYELQLKGLIPIIAHPERNLLMMENPEILTQMVSRGILVQVNSSSLEGLHGRKVFKAALHFIKNGLVHFIASDAHSCRERPPNLLKAAAIIEKKHGSEMVERLFCKNGLAVIESRPLPVYDSKNVKTRRQRFKIF